MPHRQEAATTNDFPNLTVTGKDHCHQRSANIQHIKLATLHHHSNMENYFITLWIKNKNKIKRWFAFATLFQLAIKPFEVLVCITYCHILWFIFTHPIKTSDTCLVWQIPGSNCSFLTLRAAGLSVSIAGHTIALRDHTMYYSTVMVWCLHNCQIPEATDTESQPMECWWQHIQPQAIILIN